MVESDQDYRWRDVETAIKEYDQMILDLVAHEITGII
jgi:hypothetical protein